MNFGTKIDTFLHLKWCTNFKNAHVGPRRAHPKFTGIFGIFYIVKTDSQRLHTKYNQIFFSFFQEKSKFVVQIAQQIIEKILN